MLEGVLGASLASVSRQSSVEARSSRAENMRPKRNAATAGRVAPTTVKKKRKVITRPETGSTSKRTRFERKKRYSRLTIEFSLTCCLK